MNLNSQNYYSFEADTEYMSVSQLSSWIKCEFASYNKYVKGEREEEYSQSLLLGQYMHSKFDLEEAHELFIEEHKDEIFTARGQKKAEFIKADRDYDVACKCPKILFAMTGKPEQIYTFDFAGVKWKIRVDKIRDDKDYFTDLKYVKSIRELHWKSYYSDDYGSIIHNPRAEQKRESFCKNIKVPFWELYDYWMRFAIYHYGIQTIYQREFEPLMACISKETPPDCNVFSMLNNARMELELEEIREKLPRIMALKRKEIEPIACGECSHCRKVLPFVSKKIEIALSIF